MYLGVVILLSMTIYMVDSLSDVKGKITEREKYFGEEGIKYIVYYKEFHGSKLANGPYDARMVKFDCSPIKTGKAYVKNAWTRI